jgi:hypothetical protein
MRVLGLFLRVQPYRNRSSFIDCAIDSGNLNLFENETEGVPVRGTQDLAQQQNGHFHHHQSHLQRQIGVAR